MKRTRILRSALVCCLASVALAAGHVQPAMSAEGTPQLPLLAMPTPVTEQWQVGDHWEWTVEAYEKFQIGVKLEIGMPEKILEGAEWRHVGTVGAKVAALEEGAEGPKWRLEFRAGEDMPNFASQRFTVWVYRATGKIAGVDKKPIGRDRAEYIPFDGMGLAYYGTPFPMVFMPVSTAPITCFNPRIGDHGGELRVERDQILHIPLASIGTLMPTNHIRQVWPAGAKWWSECEWWDGRDHARARLIKPEAKAATPLPAEDEAAARAHEAALRRELDDVLQIAADLGSNLKAPEEATAIRRRLHEALDAAMTAGLRARQKLP